MTSSVGYQPKNRIGLVKDQPSQQAVKLSAGDEKALCRHVWRISSSNAARGNIFRIVLNQIRDAHEAAAGNLIACKWDRYLRPFHVSQSEPSEVQIAIEFITEHLRHNQSSNDATRLLRPLVELWSWENADGAACETALAGALRLYSMGQADSALDLLYDRLDDMMRRGDLVSIDRLLLQFGPEDLPVDLILALLTATLPVRDKLESRYAFLRNAERVLNERGEYEDGILAGL